VLLRETLQCPNVRHSTNPQTSSGEGLGYRERGFRNLSVRSRETLQGGRNSQDALSCRSFSTKEPLIVGHLDFRVSGIGFGN